MYRCLLSDFFEKDMKIVMEAYVFVNKRKRERCSARMSEHPFFTIFVCCVCQPVSQKAASIQCHCGF